MFCKFCGAELPDGTNFCPICGKDDSSVVTDNKKETVKEVPFVYTPGVDNTNVHVNDPVELLGMMTAS